MDTLLVALGSDPDPDVRRRAAETLAGSREEAAVTSLASALRDDNKGVRDAAFRSLQSTGGSVVAKAIVGYIGFPDIITRNLAAGLLTQLGDASVRVLLPYLAHESQDVRKFAVDILGSIGQPTVATALLPLLQDPDENVIVSTAEALGNIRAEVAIDGLCAAYNRHDFAKPPVAEALGKIGHRKACPFLLAKMTEYLRDPGGDHATMFAVVEALGVIGDTEAEAVLRKSVSLMHGKLRSAVLHALVQISQRHQKALECPEDLLPDFLDALKDTDPAIRMSAARALTPCSQNVVTYALLEALGSSPDLDALLVAQLPQRPDTFGTAIRFLEDHRADPAKQVMTLIGKLVADTARLLMRADLDESLERHMNRAFILVADRWSIADEETRATIVDVLFRLDGDNAIEFLDALMNDPDPWLRMHVIEIIAAIADPRAPEFIARFLDDDDELVREVALGILRSRGYAVPAPHV